MEVLFLLVLSLFFIAMDAASQQSNVLRLREILARKNQCTVMPCCFDGLTARLVEDAGFELTFMTGFGVSAVHGLPDTGLITAEEMVQSASNICSSLKSIPCIGDGDTGYGNEANVMRTIQRYTQAGLAGIMIEDQVAPKRCGHTKGKQVVDRDEACRRVKAAVDARNAGSDIVILARTDACALLGIEEAIERCRLFREVGADWTFLEAPLSIEDMKNYCQSVSGPKLANMLEGGKTPILTPAELADIGFTVAAYPLTLLAAATKAYQESLQLLKFGKNTETVGVSFRELQRVVGFDEYYETMEKFGKQ